MDGRTASALCGLFILQPRRTALHFGRCRIRLPISLCVLRAYMASVLPVQFTIGLAAGLPAWDMFLVFLMCGVMGAILTHYANAAGPVLFGGGYVSVKTWWLIGLFFTLLSYIIFALVGVPYWSMLGLFTSL